MPESFMKPSIDSIIEQVLTVTTKEEPGRIADEVVRQLKPADYRLYLKQLIASRISSVAGRAREKANPVKPGLSTKQRMIREQYWPQFLATKVGLPGGYKLMGELNAADLDWLASMRRAQANDLLGKASQFEKLAAMMRESGVAALEQLPQAKGEQALAA